MVQQGTKLKIIFKHLIISRIDQLKNLCFFKAKSYVLSSIDSEMVNSAHKPSKLLFALIASWGIRT